MRECVQLTGIFRVLCPGFYPQERSRLKPSFSRFHGNRARQAFSIRCSNGDETEDVLGKIRGSLCIARQTDSTIHFSGTGKMLGLPSSWDLWHTPGGSFLEKGVVTVSNSMGQALLLPFGGGHLPGNAGMEGDAWHMDLYGVPRKLHLEDRELLLLSTWFRTGQWVSPHVLPRLDIRLETGPDRARAASTRTGSPMDWWIPFSRDRRFQEKIAQVMPGAADGNAGFVRLWMCLRGGCVPACLTFCHETWLPKGMVLLTCAGWDTWHVPAWHEVQSGSCPSSTMGDASTQMMLPRDVVHTLAAGGSNWYSTHSTQGEVGSTCGPASRAPGGKRVAPLATAGSRQSPPPHTDDKLGAAGAVAGPIADLVGSAARQSHTPAAANVASTEEAAPGLMFACPPIPRVPAHASFGLPRTSLPGGEAGAHVSLPAALDPSVVAMRSQGGHILLRPRVDGRDIGWFVLDPSTSGLAITPQAADALRLPEFGEQHLHGLGGPIVTRLRRASSLQLGALTLEGPLFTSMALDGAVRGPEAVAGILGGDVCRCAVIEVRSEPRAPGSPTPGKLSVWVHDPRVYDPPARVAVGWQKLWFIADQPHVLAGFSLDDGEEEADDGAGSAAPPMAWPWSGQWADARQHRMRVLQGDEQQQPGEARTSMHVEAGPDGKGHRSDLSPLSGPQSRLGFSQDMGLFKLSLGVGGIGAIFGTRIVQGLGLPERCFLLPPSSGMVSAAGGNQARWQDVSPAQGGRGMPLQQEPSIATFRLPSLEFVGATFKYIRTLVHLGAVSKDGAGGNPEDNAVPSHTSGEAFPEDPADLELSVYADGAVCAEILRECHLVLDVGGDRLSFSNVQKPTSQFGKTGKFF